MARRGQATSKGATRGLGFALSQVVVRPVRDAAERAQWDRLMDELYYLGFRGMLGDGLPAPGVQDLILFTVKMQHNAAAVASLPPMIGPGTVALALQNGMDNGEQMTAAVGPEPVMIGSAFMEGRISKPGVVTQGGLGTAGFGEMTVGITERDKRLHREFLDAGWRVELHENVPGMLWKKFAYIVGSATVCASNGCRSETDQFQ